MKKLDRRLVLRGFGGVLVSLPVLEGCRRIDGFPSAPPRELPREPQPHALSDALAGAPAKRFIALMCPNGVEPRLWFPTGGETDFVLNAQNGPLAAVRPHLLLTSGIDNKVAIDGHAKGNGNGHAEGVSSLLTGWACQERPPKSNNWFVLKGPSIDQTLSDFHAANGYLGRVRGIHMGEESPGSYSGISILPNGDREDYFWNLDVLFDSAGGTNRAALENARLRKKSVLDGSKADFTALAARVSGEDKRRVEAHLDALRSIEKRFEVVASCRRPTVNTQPMDGDQKRDLYWDVIAAAFACDATRVATVLFHHSGGGGPKLPWINVYEDIHELSHQVVGDPPTAKSHQDFTAYHQWWSRKLVSLVSKLKAVTLPDGSSAFDDTIIFQGSEIAWDHACPDMPFTLVAGEKTPLRTGRYVRLAPRAMHTHLLTTLLNAHGHPAKSVGDPQYVPGNLNAALLKPA